MVSKGKQGRGIIYIALGAMLLLNGLLGFIPFALPPQAIYPLMSMQGENIVIDVKPGFPQLAIIPTKRIVDVWVKPTYVYHYSLAIKDASGTYTVIEVEIPFTIKELNVRRKIAPTKGLAIIPLGDYLSPPELQYYFLLLDIFYSDGYRTDLRKEFYGKNITPQDRARITERAHEVAREYASRVESASGGAISVDKSRIKVNVAVRSTPPDYVTEHGQEPMPEVADHSQMQGSQVEVSVDTDGDGVADTTRTINNPYDMADLVKKYPDLFVPLTYQEAMNLAQANGKYTNIFHVGWTTIGGAGGYLVVQTNRIGPGEYDVKIWPYVYADTDGDGEYEAYIYKGSIGVYHHEYVPNQFGSPVPDGLAMWNDEEKCFEITIKPQNGASAVELAKDYPLLYITVTDPKTGKTTQHTLFINRGGEGGNILPADRTAIEVGARDLDSGTIITKMGDEASTYRNRPTLSSPDGFPITQGTIKITGKAEDGTPINIQLENAQLPHGALPQLPPGEYTVKVRSPGFTGQDKVSPPSDMTAEAKTTLNFTTKTALLAGTATQLIIGAILITIGLVKKNH